MNKEFVDKIYGILVEEVGAREADRQMFIYHILNGCREYRFQGKLGFGGKFYAGNCRVSCYPEDETPERKLMIEKANERLESLKNS